MNAALDEERENMHTIEINNSRNMQATEIERREGTKGKMQRRVRTKRDTLEKRQREYLHGGVVPSNRPRNNSNRSKRRGDNPPKDMRQPSTSGQPVRVPNCMQMQVHNNQRQPSGRRNRAKQQVCTLGFTRLVVVGRRGRDTIGCALDTTWVSVGWHDCRTEETGGNGSKEDQITWVLQLVGQDDVRDDQDERQAGRDSLENIGDKEALVEDAGLVECVCLWAGQAASAATVGIVRVSKST